MMAEPYEELVMVLEEEGYEPYAYSGRAMYGERCVAVDLQNDQALFRLGMTLGCSARVQEMLFDLDLAQVYVDSMGLGIVVYWRNVPWPQERDDG